MNTTSTGWNNDTSTAGLLPDEVVVRDPAPTWQVVYTVVVLVGMFTVLVTDRVATDCVMLTALTAFYIAGIIGISEALEGFSSQGLLTVLALFAVAEGLNKTGALNWYVGKLLGAPRTVSEAQLRVMIPIAVLSGFINDTPLVTVALPSVIQWARRIKVHPRFLLMPLSFAALLGGVSTLIGTSTNLVIAGLLQDRYKNDPAFQNMSLFALGQYGVPVAMVGIAYVVVMSPWLLGWGRHGGTEEPSLDSLFDNVLLGARLTQWSPAAGRTVQRSGLRDSGGIYLVRVQRCSTGNVHHAVGPDFVLQTGDILYFTGLVETFGDFCVEHGLEVVTNEVQQTEPKEEEEEEDTTPSPFDTLAPPAILLNVPLAAVHEDQIGYTLESLLEADPQDKWRILYHMQDYIRGEEHAYVMPYKTEVNRIIVATSEQDQVVLAVDTSDRSGLLLDISKCLAGMEMELHHTEATVEKRRSLSIWRCSRKMSPSGDVDCTSEMWSVLQALLEKDSGVAALKRRGLRVVRAVVVPGGRLVGSTAAAVDFRRTYKAAIVAIQKEGSSKENVNDSIATAALEVGDALVLQVEDDSPLLEVPPEHFYDNLVPTGSPKVAQGRASRLFGLGRTKTDEQENPDNDNLDTVEMGDGIDTEAAKLKVAVWKDLRVVVSKSESANKGEFLAAMKVAPASQLSGKTASQSGIDKLPDVLLISVERPVEIPVTGSGVTSNHGVPMNDPLNDGDVLWFSCATAASVGDLRKIPGLMLYQDDEVNKIESSVQDRRLVQAVVARKGALVGMTIKDARFRTRYGAAVIAVQREGQRVHDHPGNIKLHAGDVLLLDAGTSFMTEKIQKDRAFVLVAEVKNSAPPRMRMLIPALIFTVGAYACFMAKVSTLIGCAMVAIILMVSTGILSQNEARDAIRWEIYLTIASAFGIGTAMENSGVAATVASWLVSIGHAIGMGNAGLLGAVYLSTVLISQVVANNAAAALIFPIAMDAAESTGVDLMLMSYTIMLAASAAFMTPFGYQTNLMVMGPGGYTTTDFLIFGTPMQIVLLLATTTYLVSPLWVCWLVTFVVCATACTYRVWQDLRSGIKLKAS